MVEIELSAYKNLNVGEDYYFIFETNVYNRVVRIEKTNLYNENCIHGKLIDHWGAGNIERLDRSTGSDLDEMPPSFQELKEFYDNIGCTGEERNAEMQKWLKNQQN